jgi:lysophospholipase L1-like esterase
MATRLSVRKKILFSTVIVIVFVVLADLALHMIDVDRVARHYEDGQRFYREVVKWEGRPYWYGLAPNHVGDYDGAHVTVNCRGLRDREIPYEKPKNTFRILSMGDSVTFGWGVPADRTYSKAMERVLNAAESSGRQFEVINTGCPSFNTWQEYMFLKTEGMKYKPDAVVLLFTDNDTRMKGPVDKQRVWPLDEDKPTTSSTAAKPVPKAGAKGKPTKAAKADRRPPQTTRKATPKKAKKQANPDDKPVTLYSLMLKSAIFSRIDYEIRKRKHARVVSECNVDLGSDVSDSHPFSPRYKGWRIAKQALVDMIELCRKESISLLVVQYGFRGTPLDKLITERLSEVCENQNAPFYNTLPLFIGRNYVDMINSLADWHPNPTAHEIMARGIVEEMRKHGMIPGQGTAE